MADAPALDVALGLVLALLALAALVAELTRLPTWDETLASAEVSDSRTDPVAVASTELSDDSRLAASLVMLAISELISDSSELAAEATCDEREAIADERLAEREAGSTETEVGTETERLGIETVSDVVVPWAWEPGDALVTGPVLGGWEKARGSYHSQRHEGEDGGGETHLERGSRVVATRGREASRRSLRS